MLLEVLHNTNNVPPSSELGDFARQLCHCAARYLLKREYEADESDLFNLGKWLSDDSRRELLKKCVTPSKYDPDAIFLEEEWSDCLFATRVAKASKLKKYRQLLAVAMEKRELNTEFEQRWSEIGSRLLELGRRHSLEPNEIRVLLIRSACDVEIAFDWLWDQIRTPSRNQWSVATKVSELMGISRNEAAAILGETGKLQSQYILEDDGDIYPATADFILGFGTSVAAEEKWVRLEPSSMELDDSLVSASEKEMLRVLVQRKSPDCGLNILFYGSPGTGKTELAKILSKIWHGDAWIFRQDEDKGTHRQGDLLRSALVASENKLDPAKDMLVMDEMEQVLDTGDDNRSKRFINPLLERSKLFRIWIVNSTRDIDPSTMRRFDFAVGFKPFGDEQRQRLWEKLLRDRPEFQGIWSSDQLRDLARRYRVNAGGIVYVLRLLDPRQDSPEILRQRCEVLLESHCKAIGVPFEKQAAPNTYCLDGLSIQGKLMEVEEALGRFSQCLGAAVATGSELEFPNLNVLLSGPPGTGKTEYAKHLARALGRPLMQKKASDLLGKYVGESEQNIRDAFEEAQSSRSVLFLDEADSLFQNRQGAQRNWEVSQVNEILQSMESFKGILICASNFNENFDPASMRRFAFRISFGYLEPDGIQVFFDKFFVNSLGIRPTEGEWGELKSIRGLAPGDFKAVKQRYAYAAKAPKVQQIIAELQQEARSRQPNLGKRMGF